MARLPPILTFRVRVAGAILLSQMLVVLFGLGAQLFAEHRSLQEFSRISAGTFARCIAHMCAPLLKSGDDRSLGPFLQMARQQHGESLTYAVVEPRPEGEAALDVGGPVPVSGIREGGEPGTDFEVLVPIEGVAMPPRVLRIGVSTAAIRQRMLASALRSLALVLAAMGIGAGLAYFVDRRLRRSIHELLRATEAMREGALDVRADVRSGDEMQRLAVAFNAMAERLAAVHGSLEQQVNQRTHELDAERRKLAAIVSTVDAAILLVDREGRIAWANSVAEAWFGTGIVGRTCHAALGGEEGEATPSGPTPVGWPERLGGGEWVRRAQRAGEAVRHYEVSTAPISDPAGGPAFTLQVLRDITEKKLMEGRLLQAERLMAMGVMAAGLAHELNNPLGIVGAHSERLAELLQKGAEASRISACAEAIERNIFRCKAIISRVLAFAHQGAAEPRATHLNAVAQEAVGMVAHQAEKEGKRVRVRRAEGLPVLRSDPDGLVQVMVNLITNALDAVPSGGEVEVFTALEPGVVVAGVSDGGAGIAEEDLPRIFEPFFTTKPAGKGTGLGLAICARIVERLGGRIEVRSHLGRGSVFLVRLPSQRT